MSPRASGVRLRVGINAAVVATGLLLALPLIAAAERVRRGAGRQVAVGTIRLLARLCGVSVTVHDELPSVDGPVIFVPNHGSPADIAAMLLTRPDVRFAAASELFDKPILRLALRALDAVPVDREHPRAAMQVLREVVRATPDLRLVAFPEGGMAEPGAPLRFKTGPFVLAIDAGASVVPVAITGADAVLPRRCRFAVRPGRISVRVLEPLPTAGLTAADRRSLRDRAQSAVAGALGGVCPPSRDSG